MNAFRLFRRTLFPAVLAALAVEAQGGGLVTHTGHSAAYSRMLSRNASTDPDAVSYNPAGLTSLPRGWHLSLHSQSLFQTTEISSYYPLLNRETYTGQGSAPLIPSLFSVCRTGPWAFSLSALPVLPALSEEFKQGIPSAEIRVIRTIESAEPAIGSYDAALTLRRSATGYGIQAGAAYKVNDQFSMYGGLRVVLTARNLELATGAVQVAVKGKLIPAADYFASQGELLRNEALEAASLADALQTEYINAGAGPYALATLLLQGILSPERKEQLLEGLLSLNVTGADDSWTMQKVRDEYDRAATTRYGKGSACAAAGADLRDKLTSVRQTGNGLTPVIGFMLSPSDDLLLTARYEYKTRLKIKNRTRDNDSGLYPDGETSREELPALFACGAGFRLPPKVELQFSYNLHFDKGARQGNNFRDLYVYDRLRKRYIDRNTTELALGVEYAPVARWSFSFGGLLTQTGVHSSYQSDFSFAAPSVTLAGGLRWQPSEGVAIDAGYNHTLFRNQQVVFNDPDLFAGKYSESYGRRSLGFAVGVTLHLPD